MNKSKLGMILYLMVNIPYVWRWKIGITTKSMFRRAKQVDRDAPGIPVALFGTIIPGAYFVEQWLHKQLFGLRSNYYKGDGHTEWFNIVAAIPAFMVMHMINCGWAWVISRCMSWDALDWYLTTLRIIAGWIVHTIKQIT